MEIRSSPFGANSRVQVLPNAFLDRAFGLRELLCIAGAQHHIRVGPVLRWLPASLMNQSYGLLRAA